MYAVCMRMNAAEARRRLPHLLRIAAAGDVVMVDVHGKATAAIVAAEVGERARSLSSALVSMQDIESAARKAGEIPGVESIVLFGSYARGDAGASSDIDLLVVIDRQADPKGGGPFWEVYSAVRRVLVRCRRRNGLRIPFEVHPMTSGTWRSGATATGLLRAVRQEGIVLT